MFLSGLWSVTTVSDGTIPPIAGPLASLLLLSTKCQQFFSVIMTTTTTETLHTFPNTSWGLVCPCWDKIKTKILKSSYWTKNKPNYLPATKSVLILRVLPLILTPKTVCLPPHFIVGLYYLVMLLELHCSFHCWWRSWLTPKMVTFWRVGILGVISWAPKSNRVLDTANITNFIVMHGSWLDE